jgi:uncharacterized membrane protein
VLRGLGVLLPPLLTIVILVWILSTIQDYVLAPFEGTAKRFITWSIDDTRTTVPVGAQLTGPESRPEQSFNYQGTEYTSINSDQWIPVSVYEPVRQKPGLTQPTTSRGFYHRYVELTYLKPHVVLPIFLTLFILLLYLLGRFLAYGVGRMVYNAMEATIGQLPIIRSVYTSVKQVTDFVFSENETEFTRVVAVEYPRRGIWSLGFVTGGGLRSVATAADESVLSVLVPTSPMPATGFTITVRKSETIDLDITVDQAFQFIVSCGVVVPMSEQYDQGRDAIQAAVEQRLTQDRLDDATLGETS